MTIKLSSTRLSVELATPGGRYRGSRFDWTGFITQVTLDNRHRFCCAEAEGGSDGAGLCNEFGIFSAIGYDDAAPGEWFPKLGVGLLQRTDENPYSFQRSYPVNPFPIQVSTTAPGQAILKSDPLECNGFAVRLEKRVSVIENSLVIGYRLENVGQREVITEEYAHNFMRIDDHDIDLGYQLRTTVPVDCNGWSQEAGAVSRGGRVLWQQRPLGEFYHRVGELSAANHRMWQLRHEPSGVWVQEETDVPWCAFSLYGTPAGLSPEAFIAIRIIPGQTYCWSRHYTFGSENRPTVSVTVSKVAGTRRVLKTGQCNG
jgi:hypothetical protein